MISDDAGISFYYKQHRLFCLIEAQYDQVTKVTKAHQNIVIIIIRICGILKLDLIKYSTFG